jgi:site-specific recombinase XerD
MKPLSEALQEYLSLRRAVGYKLEDEGRVLPQFVSFLEERGATYITSELAVRWAAEPMHTQPTYPARRLRMVRLFAEHRSAEDPRTEIPPQKLLPDSYHRRPPYIYTDKQVRDLIKAADALPSTVRSTTGLRARTYSTLFGLLAVTGMRISEALALNREDVDLTEGVITVHGSKFGKSRLVPLHSSSRCALQHYADFRDRIYPRRKTPSFLVDQRGTRLGYGGVLLTFRRLSREIGLRSPADSHPPRMHDLRHRFAVRTLIRWYRAGVDIEQHIQELSTFLGHVEVSHTYWYLSAVPELMQLAAARVQHREGGSVQ